MRLEDLVMLDLSTPQGYNGLDKPHCWPWWVLEVDCDAAV